MSLKQTSWVWVIVAFVIGLLMTGCGTESNDPLKAPSVYKDPQVSVTRSPTEIAVELATSEAEVPTEEAAAVQPLMAGPTADEDQFLMDEIERLLDKIERKLDQTDVNP